MKEIKYKNELLVIIELPDDAYNINKCWQEYGKVRADRKCTEIQYFSKNPTHPNYRTYNPKEMGVVNVFNKETSFDILGLLKDLDEDNHLKYSFILKKNEIDITKNLLILKKY